MGTNYYVTKENHPIDDLFTKTTSLHIGKVSGSWVFCFNSQHIKTYAEWMTVLQNPENVIANEYGDKMSFDTFLKTITDRPRPIGKSDPEWRKKNRAILCENGFNRKDPDMSNRESWETEIITHEHGFDFMSCRGEWS